MATEIKYKGTTLVNLEAGQTATLECAGKKLTDNVIVSASADSGISWDGSDLTGTVWKLPQGWDVIGGYGKFKIKGVFSARTSTTLNYSANKFVNNEFSLYLGISPAINGQAEQNVDSTYYFYFYDPNGGKSYSYGGTTIYPIIISITGGDDTTNPSLISWLKRYGEILSA